MNRLLPSASVVRPIIYILVLIFFAVAPSVACAESIFDQPFLQNMLPDNADRLREAIDIDAETLEWNEDTGVAVADGNVKIIMAGRTIRTGRIRYDSKAGVVEMFGGVRYSEAGDDFKFDAARVDVNAGTGVLDNGSLRIGTDGYLVAGDRFEKTGPKSFRITRGSLTTCPCDPVPDWRIGIRNARVTIDGYAVGTGVTFRVRDVPVLWLPWAAFPVKMTRQSGILIPSVSSSSSKGFSLTVPVYWAINDWSDATLTVESMQKRGIRPEVEYRAALTPTTWFEATVTDFMDTAVDERRQRTTGIVKASYGDALSFLSKWDFAGDPSYYRDLVDDDFLRKSRFVASRAVGSMRGDDSANALSVVFATSQNDVRADNTVQRLPEYAGTLMTSQLTPWRLLLRGDAQATWFTRRDGANELRGRTGVMLSRPFALYHSIFLTPYVAGDALASNWRTESGESDDGGRVVPWGGIAANVDLRRDYQLDGGGTLVHGVEATADLRRILPVDQSDLPITDAWSRLAGRTLLTMGLNQRFIRTGMKDGPREVASAEVEWAYELSESSEDASPYVDPLSPFASVMRDQIDLVAGRVRDSEIRPSDLLARFTVRPGIGLTAGGLLLADLGTMDLSMASLNGEWMRDKAHFARVSWSKVRYIAEDMNASAGWRLLPRIGVKADGNWSLLRSELTESSIGATYYPRSECWNVGLEFHRKERPVEDTYKLTFELKGIGSFGG